MLTDSNMRAHTPVLLSYGPTRTVLLLTWLQHQINSNFVVGHILNDSDVHPKV